MDTDAMMTIEEAAEVAGVSRQAIYAAIKEGKVETIRMFGKLLVLRESLKGYTPRAYRGRPRVKAGEAERPNKRKGEPNE